jgi:hypothetical protein
MDEKDDKNEKEIRQKELAAVLSLFDQSEFSDKKEVMALKSFSNLIEVESSKRKIGPLELIRHLVENKEELIELLEKKKIKTAPSKFSKIYTHSEIENIMHKVLKTQKLNDKGITTMDEDFMAGKVKIWESKGVEYIVKVDDLLKFEGRPPKAYVSQIKNLSLLMSMVQEQQFKNDTKEAKCEFSLSYYAGRRGYTKEEIQQGGYFKELKRDLLTGAYTTYRIDKIIIEGKKFTAHGIPNFYILYEPEDLRDNWKVEFNNPYNAWITKILNGEAGQYFTREHKAIEDRITTEKPYLFLFYMQLTKRKRANLFTMPVKIGSLLADMQIDEQILARPKECFELLKECLIYFSQHYQPIPELESFNIYNDFHKTKTVKLPLSISEAFKQYPYEDFKDLLKDIEIKDIREAYISFKRPYVKPISKEKQNLNEEEQSLLDKTLKWFNDPSNPNKITIPFKDQESLIKRYIKKFGAIEYERLFKIEGNKFNANAVEFLTKVLPNYKQGEDS